MAMLPPETAVVAPAESPHPAVWTSSMIVLGVVVFSAAFGLGTAIFRNWDPFASSGDDDDDEGDETPWRR